MNNNNQPMSAKLEEKIKKLDTYAKDLKIGFYAKLVSNDTCLAAATLAFVDTEEYDTPAKPEDVQAEPEPSAEVTAEVTA